MGINPIKLAGLFLSVTLTIVSEGLAMDHINNAQKTPLISRQVLFGNPIKASPSISPDGQWLAYIAPLEGVLNIWIQKIGESEATAKPLTHDKGRGIQSYDWAYDNEHILYVQDKDGDENWGLYKANIVTGKEEALIHLPKVQLRIEKTDYKYPNEVLISINDRDPQFHDLWRLNIRTGERKKIFENKEFNGFFIDNQFEVQLASKELEDGGTLYMKKDDQGNWQEFMSIPFEETTTPLTFSLTGDILYLVDSRERDTAALVAFNLKTNEKKTIAENDNADIDGAFFTPKTHELWAAKATYLKKEWTSLHPEMTKAFELLKTVSPGEIEVIDCSLDNQKWIVGFFQDVKSSRYYLYDRKTEKAEFLFSVRPILDTLPLAKMYPIIIKARDGLELVSYLSLPVDVDHNHTGIPTQPVPMVLLVHGGPWARDKWGIDSLHQWLANRGYAVLSVNYRSSLGFGKKFLNAGNGEWAQKMHDDLLDAVQWAVNQKIALKDKVAIMGGSYGGYATLVGMTMTPDIFACGVDLVGPSNLETLIQSIPAYWKPLYKSFTKRIGGDPATEEGRVFLRSRSPLTYVDNIQRPLLIGQGSNDPRVVKAESDQIAESMKKKNIPVTYLLYPDEGHGFVKPENRISFWAVTEQFLAKNLGGRVEPLGKDIAACSMKVEAGELAAIIH
jgi:dipeptidyl aminopeptidase/acylaminoacyl peptidase